MKSGVEITEDLSEEILESLRHLGQQEVLVGVPESDAAREDSAISNAQIGYQNEFGSPALNIPPRPHLVPGVESAERQTIPLLRRAAIAVIDGGVHAADAFLNQAGQIAVGKVQTYIQTANFVPLSVTTVQKRAERGRQGAQQELDHRLANGLAPSAESNFLARPLIDTGSYIQSITYVVRDTDGETTS